MTWTVNYWKKAEKDLEKITKKSKELGQKIHKNIVLDVGNTDPFATGRYEKITGKLAKIPAYRLPCDGYRVIALIDINNKEILIIRIVKRDIAYKDVTLDSIKNVGKKILPFLNK